jgi:hypothetical protein
MPTYESHMQKNISLRAFFGELCDNGQVLVRYEAVVAGIVDELRRVVILVLNLQGHCSSSSFSVHEGRERVYPHLKLGHFFSVILIVSNTVVMGWANISEYITLSFYSD